MPSPLPRQDRWNRFAHKCSINVGLPQITVGSAPALSVSWPAQRSLALQPADSPSRLMRPSTPEAPAALLPPPPLRLLPGGAIQFPGGFISRCGPTPFTAHCYRWLQQLSLDSEPAGRTFSCYCSFAYSALASFRMGMSGSASFQRVRKSWYAVFALAVSPERAQARARPKCASAPIGSFTTTPRWLRSFWNSAAAALPWCAATYASPRR